jgi:hypothetical protein
MAGGADAPGLAVGEAEGVDGVATIKKGLLTHSKEWWKHLRWTKRQFWKGERHAAKLRAIVDLQAMQNARKQTSGRSH